MVATRFAVALHILLVLAAEPDDPATSARLARSVGTNPVVIRRLAGRLVRAGLVRIRRGPGGAELARPASEITLADVWAAMQPDGAPLLPTHPGPGRAGEAFGQEVPATLRAVLDEAETAMHGHLAQMSLAAVRDRMRTL